MALYKNVATGRLSDDSCGKYCREEYIPELYINKSMEESEPGPSQKTRRIRITIPEKQLVVRCYHEKNGQSWENVLQHIRDNLDSLPLANPATEYYLLQDDNVAISRIRRIITDEMKNATNAETMPTLSGPMVDVIKDKMKYAHKKTPEERYEAKFAQLSSESSSNTSDSSASSEQRDSTKKRKRVKKKNGKKQSKGKAEKAHEAMCKKAMKTLDKVNALLDKYGDSSSTD